MGRRLLLGACLSFLMFPAFAESPLASWFSQSPAAATYEAVRSDLEGLLVEAQARGIPPELVMRRMSEGAGKRVPPAKLLEALRKDIDNYVFVLAVLARVSPGAASVPGGLELLERGGMVLRSGMDPYAFEEVLRAAVARGGDAGRSISALVAVVALGSRVALEVGDRRDLAISLALSKETEDRFSMLAPLFLRGKGGKLATHDLVLLSVATLDAGGGFLQLESEISRRLK